MKIKNFTVKNYRSILSAKLTLNTEKTVILAENNAGKSNILKALLGTFKIIEFLKDNPEKNIRFFQHRYRREDFDGEWSFVWETDYPKSLQTKILGKGRKHSPTKFRLDFRLDSNEISEFEREIGSSINGDLAFEISISEEEKFDVSIPKRAYGGTGKKFTENKYKIAKFISERIDSAYIPAIRPASLSTTFVDNLLDKYINEIPSEDVEKYNAAIKTITDIQNKQINKLSSSLSKSVKSIIPNVKKISIKTDRVHKIHGFSRYRNCDIFINDGNETSIYEKGDGVKSLVALAIIQHSKESIKNLTLLIEEPETHLHPKAIKETKKIIDEISHKNQIIITTHSPLFVDRENIKSNIIIKNNEASIAQKISDIRNCLGVTIDDNLINSEVALLVEGRSDEIALKAILKAMSEKVKEAITSRQLTIHYMGGLDHLIERKSTLDGLVFKHTLTFVDADTEGKNATSRAIKGGILSKEEFLMTTIPDFNESEFEDYYDISFFNEFTEISKFQDWKTTLLSKKGKWSKRIKDLYSRNGASISEEEMSSLKIKIANKISEEPDPCRFLDNSKIDSLNILKMKLEVFLN